MKRQGTRSSASNHNLRRLQVPVVVGLILLLWSVHGWAQRLPPLPRPDSNDQPFCNGFELLSTCGLPPKPPVVALEQLSPLPGDGSTQSIQFRAGWPLIFRVSVADEDMLGLGRVYGEQGFEIQNWQFPEVGQGGAIVFTDPDGIWSFSVPPPSPNDERILDFYPDPGDSTGMLEDVAGAPFAQDPARRFALRPEFGGPLPQQAPDGTAVQPVIMDGVQFGSDDDFPGLVILSNIGVGIVMESLADGWVPVLPRQARNLAGFTNAVGYELSDSAGRTSITAMMVVPRFLFSHIRLRDDCVGTVTFNSFDEPESCDGQAIQRVDGGPVTPLEPASSIDESLVELRAFVVEPRWNSVTNRLDYLDVVTDMDDDGQLTAADAQAAGWRVLSNEIVYSFRQIGSNVSTGQINPFAAVSFCNGRARPRDLRESGADLQYDLDGNGYAFALNAVICPGAGSGVTRPPR